MPSAVTIVAMCTGLVMASACSPPGPSLVGYYYLGPTCYDGSVPFEATRD